MIMDTANANGSKVSVLGDLSLIEMAVKGDGEAREALAVACFPRVRRLVYLAYTNRGDADDVVQIAMVTIFRDLPGLRDVERFSAWMDTVVYNVVRTHGRKQVRFASIFTGEPKGCDLRRDEITPEDEQMGVQLYKRVETHLAKIKEKKRVATVMSLFFGYVDSEVAAMMDCTVDTAKKRIQHGRRELLEHLRKDPDCSEFLKEAAHE